LSPKKQSQRDKIIKKDILGSRPKEIVAHLCNKLKTSKTLIERCSENKDIPKEFINTAKKDLNEVIGLLNGLEKIVAVN